MATDFLHAVRALPRALLRLLPQSESSKTLISSSANKHGLSAALDQTLKEGAHDMRIFGLGFLRSVASLEEHRHFTTGMYHYYSEMERQMDGDTKGLAGALWRQFPELRRAPRLQQDLEEAGALEPQPPSAAATGQPQRQLQLPMTPATAAYCAAIRQAAEHGGGERLIGHLYVRYFADLFGGRALGYPTQVALSLKRKPHFYTWDEVVERDRRSYIERIYTAINAAGEHMDGPTRAAVVEEARAAFRHNAHVYTERPGLNSGAFVGAANVIAGGAKALVSRLQAPPAVNR